MIRSCVALGLSIRPAVILNQVASLGDPVPILLVEPIFWDASTGVYCESAVHPNAEMNLSEEPRSSVASFRRKEVDVMLGRQLQHAGNVIEVVQGIEQRLKFPSRRHPEQRAGRSI